MLTTRSMGNSIGTRTMTSFHQWGPMKKLTKTQLQVLRKTAAILRKSNDPNLQIVAKNLKGGLEAVNYLFEATLAAEKKVPKKYEVQPVTLSSTNAKSRGELIAASWLLSVVKGQLQNGSIAQTSR